MASFSQTAVRIRMTTMMKAAAVTVPTAPTMIKTRPIHLAKTVIMTSTGRIRRQEIKDARKMRNTVWQISRRATNPVFSSWLEWQQTPLSAQLFFHLPNMPTVLPHLFHQLLHKEQTLLPLLFLLLLLQDPVLWLHWLFSTI